MFKASGCQALPHASFCSPPYSLDETGVVNRVFKTGSVVGALTNIADEMSVDRSHIDRGTHEPTGDRGLLGRLECHVRPELEISSLEAVGVVASQAEPSLRSLDLEAEASILRRRATVNVRRNDGARTRLS